MPSLAAGMLRATTTPPAATPRPAPRDLQSPPDKSPPAHSPTPPTPTLPNSDWDKSRLPARRLRRRCVHADTPGACRGAPNQKRPAASVVAFRFQRGLAGALDTAVQLEKK